MKIDDKNIMAMETNYDGTNNFICGAVVSLSWGGLGDDCFIHKFSIAKERLEKDFGLEVICMPNALKGSEFIANHPELRAKAM